MECPGSVQGYSYGDLLLLALRLVLLDGKKTEKAAGVGKRIAQKAKDAGVTKVVFDRGGYLYHGRVKAVADGAREGGLEF